MLLTTDEVKRMAKIMFSSYRDKGSHAREHVISQLQYIPDAIRVDFEAVSLYLIDIANNEEKKALFDEELNNNPMCTNESCAWNNKQFCKLPGLCPGRNK